MEKTNKMGTMHVKKLMLSMGIPMVISLMLQALYNIVDSIFVANMPENAEMALNALTLAFPFQILMIAIGIGTGVGANALLSKSLGQGDMEKASKTAGNAIFLGIIILILFVLFGFLGVGIYIRSQTSNPLIYDMAVGYLKICSIISVGNVFFAIFEKLLQAAGHPICSTVSMISGALTNIILDPIMIFGLLGCPAMGVLGAAWATVIGQIVSAILALIFHFKYNTNISKKLKYIKPSGKIIKGIYSIGVPAIIAQALMSVMTYGLNIILGGISETMVTAYGLYYKIQQFILFAAFGLRDAITPIVSFNHGMRDKSRIKAGIKYGLIYTAILMIAGTLIVEVFAAPFSAIFDLSGETQSLFINAMRIISISFLFAGANIAFQGIFQALEGGMESLIISILRQVVFIFPIALLFAGIIHQSAEMKWLIWTTFPITEILSLAVAVLLFKRIYNKKVSIIQGGKV